MTMKWDLLQQHIYYGMCGGDTKRFNWFMTWMAHIVQFPEERGGVCGIAVNGPSGSGKSTIFNCLQDVLHEEETCVSYMSDDFVFGYFPSMTHKTRLVVLDEWGSEAHEDKAAKLKSFLSDGYFVKEYRGKDAEVHTNNMRFVMLTGEKNWQPCDRRIVNFAMQTDKLLDTSTFFKNIHLQMKDGGFDAFKEELETWVPPQKDGWTCLSDRPNGKAEDTRRRRATKVHSGLGCDDWTILPSMIVVSLSSPIK